jgi:hypothetical protein
MQKQLSMACKQVFQGRLMPRTRRGGDSGNNTFVKLVATRHYYGSLTQENVHSMVSHKMYFFLVGPSDLQA